MKKLLQSIKLRLFQNRLFLIIFFTIIWRVALLIIPLFVYSQIDKNPLDLNSWNRWDAPHYLYIAQNGYTSHGDPANFIVFPPLYPVIVKFVDLIFNNLVFSGILISNILFIAGSLIFYILVKNEFNEKTATRTLVILNVFPTSYFFSIPYTESLFFFLIILSFYFLKENKLWKTGIAGSLGFLARTMGIILLPALILTTAVSKFNKKKKIFSWIVISIPFAITIFSYLAINWSVFGNAFAFKTILENHWYKHFAFPWESIINSLSYIQKPLTHDSAMLGYFEAVPAILGLILTPLIIRKLKFQYSMYYIFSIIFITSTNFLLSTPRYFLSIPPLFIN